MRFLSRFKFYHIKTSKNMFHNTKRKPQMKFNHIYTYICIIYVYIYIYFHTSYVCKYIFDQIYRYVSLSSLTSWPFCHPKKSPSISCGPTNGTARSSTKSLRPRKKRSKTTKKTQTNEQTTRSNEKRGSLVVCWSLWGMKSYPYIYIYIFRDYNKPWSGSRCSMGLVDLPTWMAWIYGKCRWIYPDYTIHGAYGNEKGTQLYRDYSEAL